MYVEHCSLWGVESRSLIVDPLGLDHFSADALLRPCYIDGVEAADVLVIDASKKQRQSISLMVAVLSLSKR